jgi:hypothetical protein
VACPDRGVHAHLHIGVVIMSEPMLVPVGLAELERVSGGIQIWQMPRLIRRIDHYQDDVDHRFGREPRDRGELACST